VLALSRWAKEQGIVMHENLQFKEYPSTSCDDEGGASSNWGPELKEPVPPGTVLLQVPRKLVLESKSLEEEFQPIYTEEQLEKAMNELSGRGSQKGRADFGIHQDNFWIFLKLLRITRQCNYANTYLMEQNENVNSDIARRWSPWIHALPKDFTVFTKEEQECLPFYANYAAQYQEQKFEAFCRAAAALGELEMDENDSNKYNKEQQNLLFWAFNAVASRFWKTQPPVKRSDLKPWTEMVPIGDMFNHREPPNVEVMSKLPGSVDFVYRGDGKETDLYITYGQPNNPHRFLVIFGFVPSEEDMPTVWSHLTLADNPFSVQVPQMSFRTKDGRIPKMVWDAILYALKPPPQGNNIPPIYTEKDHANPSVQKYSRQVLENHVAKELAELATLREKLNVLKTKRTDSSSSSSKNANNNGSSHSIDLISQHNDLLTKVFTRVQTHLKETSDQDTNSIMIGNDELVITRNDQMKS